MITFIPSKISIVIICKTVCSDLSLKLGTVSFLVYIAFNLIGEDDNFEDIGIVLFRRHHPFAKVSMPLHYDTALKSSCPSS